MAGALGLQGLDEVLSTFDDVVKKIKAAGVKAMDEQGDKLVDEIKGGTPLVTGAAAGSVKKGSVSASEVEITAGGSDAPYFPLIEFGGPRNPPAAPFRKALETRRQRIVPESAKTIKDEVTELKD